MDRAGAYDLFLGADDAAVLRIDGEVVLERGAAMGFPTTSVTRELTAGPHRIEVDYEQRAGGMFLNAGWAPRGEAQRAFAAALLFPDAPPTARRSESTRRSMARRLRCCDCVVAGDCMAIRFAWLVWPRRCLTSGGPVQRAYRWERMGASGRWAGGCAAAAVVIVIIAAALRFETICPMYGPFDQPAWLFELEAHARARIAALRPVHFYIGTVEQPYAGGDPINYLAFAREMTSFYAAHVREPVFLAVDPKRGCAHSTDQDAASASRPRLFSTLAVLATYLLGAALILAGSPR